MSMSLNVDKKQVARQFERAAKHYDSAAIMQQDIQQKLIEILATTATKVPEHIVDLGCGTGTGLNLLTKRFPTAKLCGVDISKGMLNHARTQCLNAELICADIETLPLSCESTDLVFSASSLQWCDHLTAVSECSRILSPGGTFALATFGPLTHQEWRRAWEGIDERSHTLNYPDLPNLLDTMLEKNIDIITSAQETRTHHFATPKEMLMSVKQLGATNANSGRQAGLMGKEKFGRFLEQLSTSSDLQLSYEVFYIIGQKR